MMKTPSIGIAALAGILPLFILLAARPAVAQDATASHPSRVEIRHTDKGFTLFRNSKPYFIKGAGGNSWKTTGFIARLHDVGGNSFRTFNADDIGTELDAAQKLGVSVTIGIWLGHREHGFKYEDPQQVAAQTEKVRQAVLQYRNHPALLMWALGNEMEGYGKGDDIAVWKAVNDLARLTKSLDPNHPVMTVIAEIGGDKVKNFNTYCPDVDVLGINSYAGGPSIAQRYPAAGGIKPYVLTEYGPPGTWEVGKTRWGAIPEPTSTAKAANYRKTYEQAIAGQPLCLGGHAFLWGNKQETTATWFGMLLPDGSRLPAVDTMQELWTGKPPARRCPVINALKVDGPDQIEPGATLTATLDVSSPNGDPLTTQWMLLAEGNGVNINGGAENALSTYAAAIVKSDIKTATVCLPAREGMYRLYAYVRDTHGGAATANIPLLVKAATTTAR